MSTPPNVVVQNRGSLALGIGVAWACLVVGYVVVVVIASALGTIGAGEVAVYGILALSPWIAMIIFIIRFASIGKSRTALGVGIGIVTIIAVALLLVAACFGLFGLSK
jgi:hypothetical protein